MSDDQRLHGVVDASYGSATDDRVDGVDDEFARGRGCGSCSVRQVALGAIVASRLYNEARGGGGGGVDSQLTASSHAEQCPSVYL